MSTETKQHIDTALQAFSDSDLRTAAIGLLNSLGYHSEKSLDLGNTPDAFLAEFDRRDRKFRKDEAVEHKTGRKESDDTVSFLEFIMPGQALFFRVEE